MNTLKCRSHWMKNKNCLEEDDFAMKQNNNGNGDSQPPHFFVSLNYDWLVLRRIPQFSRFLEGSHSQGNLNIYLLSLPVLVA